VMTRKKDLLLERHALEIAAAGLCTEGVGMTIRFFRYVVHSRRHEYEAIGWVASGDLSGVHHGCYSVLMEWTGDGEPREPRKNDEVTGRAPA
jgi:hypothetical protein